MPKERKVLQSLSKLNSAYLMTTFITILQQWNNTCSVLLIRKDFTLKRHNEVCGQIFIWNMLKDF